MRNFITVLLIMYAPIIYGQSLDSIKMAMSNGDASLISKYFSETIELSIIEDDGFYSKKQAQLVLGNFFKANKPLSYTIKHEGGSKSKSQFIIGSLKSNTKTFRAHILYNSLNDKIKIIEFRIESQN